MARLIVKSPYIKCGAGQSAGGYLKYIATRERVEIIPDDRPPTNKQTQLIAKLVKDFPDAKELMEYEDYLSHPTKATASALITLALESNWDRLSSMDGYAKYIALRPRAERLGEHGLFGDDDAVDLAAVADELNHYTEIIRLNQDEKAYMEAEVYPHIPDAIYFYDFDDTKAESATNKEKLGAEFPFTRYFYVYHEPEKADELLAQFMELEASLTAKIAALQKGAK